MSVWQWTAEDFLTRAASASPTPGGGSVSAYAGALAASMVCMVANLTSGKEKYREFEAKVQKIKAEGYFLLNALKQNLDQDMTEFERFMAALRLPQETEQEKAERTRKMQDALISATDVPLEVAENCLKVLRLAHDLAPIGNQSAVSDIGAAVHLAEGALKSALLSAEVNARGIKNADYFHAAESRREKLLREAAVVGAETAATIRSRLGGA